MILDITGTVLIPGNRGKDCPGNGMWNDLECCCDECDYMMCCLDEREHMQCDICKESDCPRVKSAITVKEEDSGSNPTFRQ